MKKVVLLIASAVCLSGCLDSSKSQTPDMPIQQVKKEEFVNVDTYKVESEEFNYLIQSNGRVKPARELKIMAMSNGTVDYCKIYNNSFVNAGATIIRLDTRDLDIKIRKASANVFNSNLDYKSDLLSQESLLTGIKKEIIDTIQRKLKSKSGLVDAELDLESILIEKDKCIIKAPFTGRIASVKVNKGMFVNNGDELFTIYTNNELFLEAKILEEDIDLIKIGYHAELLPVSSEKKYLATVAELNPVVDQNGMITIKLKILNGVGLLPGMNAAIIIQVPSRKALIVPKQAVVTRSGKPVIFTYKRGLAKWNYVVLGKDNGRVFEVKSGLQVGDTVITSNNIQLAHDSPVKIDGFTHSSLKNKSI